MFSLDEYERIRIASTVEEETSTDSQSIERSVLRNERPRAIGPNKEALNIRRKELVGKRSIERIANQQNNSNLNGKRVDTKKPENANSEVGNGNQ